MPRLRNSLLWVLTAFCLLFGGNQSVFSQILTGDILGTVKDLSGAVVQGAKVTLTEQSTNVSSTTTSNADGEYLFARLKPGIYRVSVEQKGFQASSVSDIELLVGQRQLIDVALKVGTLAQKVDVSAGGVQLVDTQTSSMGQVIQSKPIVGLPLNGRNFLQLTVLSAGVQPTGTGLCTACTWNGTTATSNTVGITAAMSVDGTRPTDNSYLLDGFETRNEAYGGVGITPSVDSIQEFKIETSTYTAEGGTAAGLVSTLMKSGTNEIHGSAFGFIRNSDLDANNFFNNLHNIKNPHYERAQYGFTAGGPVYLPHLYNGRNKTFWFFSYEGQRLEQGLSAGTGVFPSAAQLAGNLSDDSTGTGYYPTNSSFCAQYPTSGKCVNVINAATGQPFPNNVIPSGMLDATAKLWIPYMPLPNIATAPGSPNLPAANFQATPITTNNYYNIDARGDHTLTSKDQLSVVIAWENSPIDVPGITPTSGFYSPDASHMLAFTETHSFSPTVLNEARIGYTWNEIGRIGIGSQAGINYAANVWHINNIVAQPGCWGVPTATVSTFTSFGSSPNCFENQTGLYQYRDNLSIVHGKHNVKMGVALMHMDYYELDSQYTGVPSYTYNGNFSHAPLGDFLLGYVGQATIQEGDVVQNLRRDYWAGYIQDDWRMTNHLTMNVGLRYEYDTVPFETSSRCSEFNPQNGNVYTSYLTDNKAVRNCLMDPDRRNFAPRLGLAYSPGSGKTVVRAGAGIFYASVQNEELEFMSQSLPGLTSSSVLVSDVTLPFPQYTTSNGTLFPNALGGSTLGAGSTLFAIDQHNRTPYLQEWSLDVQRMLGKNWVVDVGYLGNRAVKLIGRYNENIGSFDYTGTTTYASRAPYPQWGNRIYYSDGQAISNYNALTLRIEKRISAGMYLLGSYTYSRAFDTTGTDSSASITSHFLRKLDYAPSVFNTPQRLAVSYLLELPFGHNRRFLPGASRPVDWVVGGWKLNGISTFSDGQYSGVTGGAPSLGYNNLNIGGLTTSVPDPVHGVSVVPANRSYTNWWNINAFAVPGCPTAAECATDIHRPGYAAPGSLEAPGFQNWDLAAIKDTRINERVTTELRAEFFNAWNHTQFGVPSGGVDTGSGAINSAFGLITSTRAPAREIEFGLKLLW